MRQRDVKNATWGNFCSLLWTKRAKKRGSTPGGQGEFMRILNKGRNKKIDLGHVHGYKHNGTSSNNEWRLSPPWRRCHGVWKVGASTFAQNAGCLTCWTLGSIPRSTCTHVMKRRGSPNGYGIGSVSSGTGDTAWSGSWNQKHVMFDIQWYGQWQDVRRGNWRTN